jgi:hypothetical protein
MIVCSVFGGHEMRIVLISSLALVAGISIAAAQTLDDYGDVNSDAMPSIILPDQLTNPITGDFTAREDGVAAGGDPGTSAYQSDGEVWVQPYHVEGEETLEPNSN